MTRHAGIELIARIADSMELKYVLTDQNDFAIFSELTSHKDIAGRLYGKAIGAGFCTVSPAWGRRRSAVRCYGSSDSLNLESRPEDEQIITDLLNRKES